MPFSTKKKKKISSLRLMPNGLYKDGSWRRTLFKGIVCKYWDRGWETVWVPDMSQSG